MASLQPTTTTMKARPMVRAAAPKPEPPAPECSTWLELGKSVSDVTWDWERWISPGFLHILAAKAGLGKSSLALRVAGCYLSGLDWPNGDAFTGEKGSILWLEAESAQALNFQRAGKWGLPLERILTPFADPLQDVNLCNPRHRQAILAAAKRDDVRLIILDSLSAALPGRDENDSRIQEPIAWLATLARDTGKPILACHHLRKKSQLDVDDAVSVDRLRGSSSIIQPARLIWALDAPDPAHPESLRLSVIKSNLERFPKPIGVKLDDGLVTFMTDAPERIQPIPELQRAKDWLTQMLKSGPVSAGAVLSEAQLIDIDERTLDRAKRELKIASQRKGDHWEWIL